MNISTLTSTTDKMTDTVNVLPHLKELRETWKQQDFRYTKDQQQQYDMLIAARRERVRYFEENDMVQKGPKVVVKKEVPEEEES